MSTFKKRHPLETRTQEAKRILARYPNRIPIIAEMASKSTLPPLDKCKYLVPGDLKCGQFLYVIRKRIHLSPEKAVFLFINNTIPPISHSVDQLYQEHKDEDGFLYITIHSDSTFGN